MYDYGGGGFVYASGGQALTCKSVFYDGTSARAYAIDYSNNLYNWDAGSDVDANIILPNILYVTSENNNTLAVDTNGDVWYINGNPVKVTGFPNGTRIVSVAVGDSGNTYYALDSLGQLWVWGSNNYGQFGNGTSGTSSVTPVRAATSVTNIEAISTGETGTMYAITSGNNIYRWGYVVSNLSTDQQSIQVNPSLLTTEGSFTFPAS
ncbi:hypothetical protein SBF1_6200002 [Candidatus Desulfosporosinus infrequens]|uniref:Uncharacterized protein n=1 Tax=Candidatus Desulfosporosinus infrequens TaxID=2043169 RepID=A0A2U3LM69_9FIRM|nr:hypothetical protein SBF1_6200002 [Candidatus Desulfosporosinus infrequens]